MPTNVNFLANFIARNPGCTTVQARRALCAWNEKVYNRGYYCWYFASRSMFSSKMGMDYGYWVIRDGGLYLTDLGRTKMV